MHHDIQKFSVMRRSFPPIISALLLSLACSLSGTPIPRPADMRPTSTSELPAPAVPSQTASPVPSATPLPAPTESPPKILFQENFDDDSSCFRDRSLDPWLDLGIENGKYRIRIEGDNGFNTLCNGGYDDFVLEYDVTLAEGNVQTIVGLMFRVYVGSSYNLYLTGANEFCLDHYDSGSSQFYDLSGCWGRLPERFDVASTLHVQLIAVREQLAVLIDDEVIALAYSYELDYGSFGFFVTNTSPGVTEVTIDNIVIREIRQADIDVFRDSQTGF